RPAPHSASAQIANGTLADGRSASATSPLQSSAAPAEAVTARLSPRLSGRTTSAATGRTLTISAPSIGVYCQTTITSSTPRKSAPTSAPKTSPRQTFAGPVRRRDGGRPWAPVGPSLGRAPAASPAAATGAWGAKSAPQSKGGG